MALTSLISSDLSAGTINLTSSVTPDVIESITYNNTLNQITIDSRPGVSLSFQDFIIFANQVNTFHAAIISTYTSIPVFSSAPYTQIVINELHDVGLLKWNLVVTTGSLPRVCNYEATDGIHIMQMYARASNKVLTFPEWQYFLIALNHYRLSIQNF